MIARYRTSWRLVQSSFIFLVTHPDLLLYPIVAVAAAAVVLVLGGAGILVWVDYDVGFFFQMAWLPKTALTFAFYVVTYCIAIYTNTALVAMVLQIMQGQPPDMPAAWRLANRRAGSIAAYAVLMATVGMLLRLLLRPVGALGKVLAPVVEKTLVFTVVGLAWNAVPYFVVPVLIAEQAGPLSAVKRSSALIKHIWGDDVVVNASVWVIFALPLLVVLLLGGPAIAWAIATLNELTVVATVYVVVMLVLLTFLLKMAMDGIFAAAAYRFAAEQRVEPPFGEDALRHAFRNRPNRWVNRVRRWLRLMPPPQALM